ncbi:MAG: hypothetical protein FJ297_00070 [Planctomycetes bacterium]|nr:hypothetical protein [Planctomycetota bacterium]
MRQEATGVVYGVGRSSRDVVHGTFTASTLLGFVPLVPWAARAYFLGREFTFAKNFRIAPFGNRTGHPIGKYPHYHYRPSNPAPPGQGIGRHRPWE